ncbi:MAG: hypothetical protein OXH31_03460 [Gammaproteobacteria bacterium]|nr:hypothetical protein [Gammaproteobacteria bacterium]
MSAYRKDMMMMTRKHLVLTLISLTSGIGLGLLFSFLLFQPNPTYSEVSARESVQVSSPEETLVESSWDLSDVIAVKAAPTRRHSLYQLIEDKSAQQIAELLADSLTLDSADGLYFVQRILFAELARVEPESALELVWRTERVRWETLLDIVAIHWSAIDLKSALRAFSLLSEPWKDKAIKAVFQNHKALTATELEQLAESLDIAEHFVRWAYETELATVIDEPEAAFNLTKTADISVFDKSVMVRRIASRWVRREDIENVGTMLTLANKLFTDSEYSLLLPVITEIAALDPQTTWEQLSSMSPDVQKRLDSIVFNEWLKQDPIAAVQALKTQEYLPPSDSELRYMWRQWARSISDQILEHLDLVPEDYKLSVISTAIGHLAERKPPGNMLDLLSKLRERGFDTTDATQTVVSYWSRREPEAAVQWVIKNFDIQKSSGQRTLRSAFESLVSSDPDKAMEIALGQPAEIALEQSVVMTLLRQGKFEKGLSFIAKIRDAPDYPIPYRNINHVLIQAGRIDDVLALASQLDESEVPNFYRSLARPWVRFELESLIEYLPKLPTAKIRGIVASNVLWEQERYPYLTEEEFEFVRSFIPEETN